MARHLPPGGLVMLHGRGVVATHLGQQTGHVAIAGVVGLGQTIDDLAGGVELAGQAMHFGQFQLDLALVPALILGAFEIVQGRLILPQVLVAASLEETAFFVVGARGKQADGLIELAKHVPGHAQLDGGGAGRLGLGRCNAVHRLAEPTVRLFHAGEHLL